MRPDRVDCTNCFKGLPGHSTSNAASSGERETLQFIVRMSLFFATTLFASIARF